MINLSFTPLYGVVICMADSCQFAAGLVQNKTLLSGLERDAETSSSEPGEATTKQLSNYRGSMPDTSDTTKVTARRGKGSRAVAISSVSAP